MSKAVSAVGAVVLVALTTYGGFRIWKHWSYGGFRYHSCTISFSDDYGYWPAQGAPRFRAYIFSGLNSTWRDFSALELNKTWISGLRDMGGDVVVFSMPFAKPCWFRNDGLDYRQALLSWFDHTRSQVETAHQKPPKTLVAGGKFRWRQCPLHLCSPSQRLRWLGSGSARRPPKPTERICQPGDDLGL